MTPPPTPPPIPPSAARPASRLPIDPLYLGAFLILFGCFFPAFHLPVIGSFCFFNQPDGVLLLALAGLAAFAHAMKWSGLRLFCAFLILGIIAYDFLDAVSRLKEIRAAADSPLASAFAAAAQLSIAWPILFLGAVLLFPLEALFHSRAVAPFGFVVLFVLVVPIVLLVLCRLSPSAPSPSSAHSLPARGRAAPPKLEFTVSNVSWKPQLDFGGRVDGIRIIGEIESRTAATAQSAHFAISAFDAQGRLLDTNDFYLHNLPPGSKVPFESRLFGADPALISRVEVQFRDAF